MAIDRKPYSTIVGLAAGCLACGTVTTPPVPANRQATVPASGQATSQADATPQQPSADGMALQDAATAATAAWSPCAPCPQGQWCDWGLAKCVDKVAVARVPCSCSPACSGAQICDQAMQPPKCTTPMCGLPSQFAPAVQRWTSLQVAKKSVGCDLDDDGKVNNAWGPVLTTWLGKANAAVELVPAHGQRVMLLESSWPAADPKTNSLRLLRARPLVGSTCALNPPQPNCAFTVDAAAYQLGPAGIGCPAVSEWPQCALTADKWTCLSASATVTIEIAVAGQPCGYLQVLVRHAQLRATGAAGQGITQGLLCGVVRAEDFSFDAQALLGGTITPDMDVNGDGTKESASIALVWQSVAAQIVGMTPPP